jgi:hypothetical protein
MGAHVAIIDDPVKNRKEANSAAFQKGVLDWYTSTLYTRLAPDGQVLVTLTRWHELDLAGQLLKLANGGRGRRPVGDGGVFAGGGGESGGAV